MPRKPRRRVYDPRQHRRRWSVEIREGSSRVFESFATEADAIAFVKAARRVAGRLEVTVDETIDRYLGDMRRRRLAESTVGTTATRLRQFLAKILDHSPEDITPADAAKLYRAATERWAVDTHRNVLSVVRKWWAFCRAEKWVARDPWSGVVPEGKRKRGKTQLRLDEARIFSEHCLSVIDTEESALPALVTLILARRAGEVVALTARDVDDGGRLLWVEDAKTPAGKVTVVVPEVLVQPLRRRALAAEGGRLWKRSRHWLGYHVRRLCLAAGVTKVCPHSMRGLHWTLARKAGATAEDLVRQLGHTNRSVGERHYEAPGTGTQTDVAKVALRIVGGEE